MAQKVGGGWDCESATAGTDVTISRTRADGRTDGRAAERGDTSNRSVENSGML